MQSNISIFSFVASKFPGLRSVSPMSFVTLEKSVYDYILRWQAPLSGLLGLFPVGSQFLVFHGESPVLFGCCCDLNLKCPPQVPILNVSSSAVELGNQGEPQLAEAGLRRFPLAAGPSCSWSTVMRAASFAHSRCCEPSCPAARRTEALL